MQNLAVFTGDIVRSGDLTASELNAAFDVMKSAARDVGNWPESHVGFVRFRGDGWQMALPARYALRAALVMRAALRTQAKRLDTRIGIGLGDGHYVADDLERADGPAFVASGHALDHINRGPRMTAPQGPPCLRSALPLADVIIRGWTVKQAQVARALLAPAPPNHEALGTTLDRSRQMIQKQADAAGIAALQESCEIYESL